MERQRGPDSQGNSLVVLVSFLASLVAIIVFVTGRENLPDLLNKNSRTSPSPAKVPIADAQTSISPQPSNDRPFSVAVHSTPQESSGMQTIEPSDRIDVSGSWRGVLTHPYGQIQQYSYEVVLSQEGNAVEGNATITMPPPLGYSAVMRIRGSVSGNHLRFEDVQVTGSNAPLGLVWCQKLAELTVMSNTLRGTWRQDGCGAGDILLEK
jgi:hypothetical protein